MGSRNGPTISFIHVIEARVSTTGHNEMAQMAGGHLKISGRLKPLQWRYIELEAVDSELIQIWTDKKET